MSYDSYQSGSTADYIDIEGAGLRFRVERRYTREDLPGLFLIRVGDTGQLWSGGGGTCFCLYQEKQEPLRNMDFTGLLCQYDQERIEGLLSKAALDTIQQHFLLWRQGK